jgi:heparin/heparan-sulfate lyase
VVRENGFAYVVSGDVAAAEPAIAKAVSLCKPGLGRDPNSDFEDLIDIAICYDWCHAVLGSAREILAGALIAAMEEHDYPRRMRRGPGHNMHTENSLAAEAAGLALYGEHPRAEHWLRESRRAVVDEAMTGHLDRFCPDGGDFEGVQYHGARYQGEGIFAWIWYKGTGENLFTRDHPHLMNGVNWWIYLLEPHLNGIHIIQGDTNNRGISERNAISAACLSLGANDPHAGWYAIQRLRGWAAVALRPDVTQPPREGLPLYRFFRMGMVAIRSGWDIGPQSRDTLFTFLCRDYMQGWHCHQDVNHFTISRRGELAIDSGVYASNSQHMRDYARRTIAHNSLLVYDPDEPLPPGVQTRDGGQVFHNDEGFLERTGAPLQGWRTYDSCDFKAFGAGPGYYYMCGDGTRAYNYRDFPKASLVTREVVYINELNPPLIVVYDRIAATKPSSKKTWLLHTIHQPQVSGRTITAVEKDGQLIVESLLPEHARIEIIGGPGKEYWVGDPGMNCPPPNGRIWGSWRLEISPSTQSVDDVFLTLLYPCDVGSAAPRSEIVKRDGRTGCRVLIAGKEYLVLFNIRGQPGGTFNGVPFATNEGLGLSGAGAAGSAAK